MATQSYPRPARVIEPPPLEMRWTTEGGRLRARWDVASQLRQMKRHGWHARVTGSQSLNGSRSSPMYSAGSLSFSSKRILIEYLLRLRSGRWSSDLSCALFNRTKPYGG